MGQNIRFFCGVLKSLPGMQVYKRNLSIDKVNIRGTPFHYLAFQILHYYQQKLI